MSDEKDPKLSGEDAAAAEADDNQDFQPTAQNETRSRMLESIAEKVDVAYEESNRQAAEMDYEDEDGKITQRGQPAAKSEDAESASREPSSESDEEGGEAPTTPERTGGEEPRVEYRLPQDGDEQPQPTTIEGFDPEAEYELIVDGQKRKFKGSKILDAGTRALQKHDTADMRLDIATRLMNEAERRARAAAPQDEQPRDRQPESKEPSSNTDEDARLAGLAEKIQYGTREEAAAALKELHSTGRAVNPEQVLHFVSSQIGPMIQRQMDFRAAADWVQDEYKDLLGNKMTRQLFFMEENRRRAPKERGGEGDRRTYRELYKSIGDDIRKQLGLPTPVKQAKATLQERQDSKRTGPRVATPTATGRIESAPQKEETHEDVLNAMRKARRQPIHS